MEWKKVKLGDITVGDKGSYGIGAPAVDFNPFKYTYLRITDINDDGTINYAGLKSVDDPEAYKYILKPNDIVFARTGATTGRTYFYLPQDGTFVYAGFLIKFSIDPKKANPRLLKYITHSQEYYDWVRSFDTGGTRGNINAKTFADMPLCLPDRATQDKIVAILSSLDDKIENNNRINRNLEAQAQALFKSWFVDFEPFGGTMPEDWKKGNLLDVADLFDHKRIPLSGMQRDRMEKIYPYYGATSVMDYVDNYLYDGIYLLMGEDGSVMTDEGFPFLQYVEGKFWCNNHAHIMQGKNGYTTEMLYCLLNRTNVSGIVTGAVQGKISQASMKKIPVVLPPAKVCADMSGKLAPYFDEIRSLRQESQRLAALRDTLLPKLMKGEIEV